MLGISMLGVAIILAAAAPDLAALDDANLALTACGFGVHRSAVAQDLADGQFASKLSSDCSAQIAAMRREVIAVGSVRGKSGAAASAHANSMISDFLISFTNRYARRAEDQKKLENLVRALEAEGKSDLR